jgi:hypothetical protein
MSPKPPSTQSSSKDLGQFLNQAGNLPQRLSHETETSGRLIFALDATASRQASWDRACQLQGTMFMASQSLGGLQVKLCYYCGFNEFYSTPWYHTGSALLKAMSNVQCVGGYTQIGRVLDYGIRESRKQAVNAIIFIGDAIEENIDKLCARAGQLGLLGVPLFLFHEGNDTGVRRGLQQLAKFSGGAYLPFNEQSAEQLSALLSAVATYASGGTDALKQVKSSAAKQLLEQLNN